MKKNDIDTPQRVFADVVSVEAWHEAFTEDCSTVDLKVDVTFRKGIPVGGEPDSPVRFRLSLRRAEIVVIVGDSAVTIDPNTVARDGPNGTGKRTEISAQSAEHGASGEIGGNLAGGYTANAKFSGELKKSTSGSTEINQSLKLMMVLHSRISEGHSWEIKPTTSNVLDGKPWNAAGEPRFKIIDTREDRSSDTKPKINIEVRCRKEDLDIRDIELKEEETRYLFKKNRNNQAAADGYIRSQFSRAGLDVDVGSFDEKFLRLILMRVAAHCNEAQ